MREWAGVAGRGRLLLSGSVAHASLKTAVISDFKQGIISFAQAQTFMKRIIHIYMYFQAGFSFSFGTYVMCRMEQFLRSPSANKTDINELIIFENRINILNGIGILMQFLRIFTPSDIGNHFSILLLSLLMHFLLFLG